MIGRRRELNRPLLLELGVQRTHDVTMALTGIKSVKDADRQALIG